MRFLTYAANEIARRLTRGFALTPSLSLSKGWVRGTRTADTA